MVFPNQTNHYGTLFGGDALRLMDMAAFVTASRHVRRAVVTASSERTDFHVPVRRGQLAEVIGRVTRTGRTSLAVEVELWAEDLQTGKRELCTKGSFVFVGRAWPAAPIVSDDPTQDVRSCMGISSNLGFPRIGVHRELKKALEAHWAGKLH